MSVNHANNNLCTWQNACSRHRMDSSLLHHMYIFVLIILYNVSCSLPHVIHTDSTQYKQLQNSISSITSDHANVWVYIWVLFKSNIPVPLKFMLILLWYSGADPGFQVRGAHLKKLHRAEGGAKFVGVNRVKNHDFTLWPEMEQYFRWCPRLIPLILLMSQAYW